MKFEAKRITRNYCQTIHSTPDKIFPLLCPEREKEWIDGWDYKMIYSKSGLAEPGAVFTTSFEGEEEMVWIVTMHDPATNRVEFARVTPKSVASTLIIKVTKKDENNSNVDITYTYTGLNDQGNKFTEEYTEEVFLKMVKYWEKSMNYFLETGIKLLRG